MNINADWHKKHRMPMPSTLEQRVKWHEAHLMHCGCRKDLPPTIMAEFKKQGKKVCSRGHVYKENGACPVCYPGRIQKMPRYVALLRGINVGGNNIIKMSALKEYFEDMGFVDVSTYIQSGNVIFRSSSSDVKRLTNKIEKELSKAFNYKSTVMVIAQKELTQVVKVAPNGFGKEPVKYRYDVIFFRSPLTPKKAMNAIELKEGVDDARAGEHVIYFRRLVARITSSRINKIVGKPEYKFMTIRNWNTTIKLTALVEDVQ